MSWPELLPEDALRRAEELVASMIGSGPNPTVFLQELLTLSEELDRAQTQGRGADMLIGIMGSLVGLARVAASYTAILERHVWDAVEYDDEPPDRSDEPAAAWAGREVDFVARCAEGLRTLRETRGEDHGMRFPWADRGED